MLVLDLLLMLSKLNNILNQPLNLLVLLELLLFLQLVLLVPYLGKPPTLPLWLFKLPMQNLFILNNRINQRLLNQLNHQNRLDHIRLVLDQLPYHSIGKRPHRCIALYRHILSP